MIALLVATALAQDYGFPTSSADYGYFYPTAYYDHSGADWACGSITYSGHRGNDFGVGSWAGMDAGRDVVAAADGVVTFTHDGEFDRCTTGTCGTSNWIEVEHADGKRTRYLHLKQWTVAVSVGQRVTCGQYLGLAGSSGYSTGPHLHFEVRSGGVAYDPFDGPCSFPPSWWVNQGAYDGLPERRCDGPVDQCPSDANKTVPGVCGCGVADSNADGDGRLDCQESCDADPAKFDPGVCGCGVSDANADGDSRADCQESCDADPGKLEPGICGCGVSDGNADGDAQVDCLETCDLDPEKLAPGVCGCGVSDANTDGDAQVNCLEACDDDPLKLEPGVCGCGVADGDADGDAALDCVEACDDDPGKLEPGVCGCGLPDEDITGDSVPDCVVCGDGAVEAPEVCDDGGRIARDGCDAWCQPEPLVAAPPDPGTAGVRNAFVAHNVPTGNNVLWLVSARLGSAPIPGCPGVSAPLSRPVLIGSARGGGGDASMTLNVPAGAATRTFAMVAVDLDACRVSAVTLAAF